MGNQIPPNNVTAHYLNNTFSLGAKSEDEDGIWFVFEYAKTEEEFEKGASNVLVY